MSEFVDNKEPYEEYRTRLSAVIATTRDYMTKGDYPFNSGHEGFAVMRKHVDNLWTIVKNNDGASGMALRVALTVVASSVCYMVHVSDEHWSLQAREFTREEKVDHVLAAIEAELLKARTKFPPFNSAEEGFAVLLEEFDELWDDIKANKDRSDAAYHEAKQVGAMAVSYLLDCVGVQPAVKKETVVTANPGQIEAEAS